MFFLLLYAHLDVFHYDKMNDIMMFFFSFY